VNCKRHRGKGGEEREEKREGAEEREGRRERRAFLH